MYAIITHNDIDGVASSALYIYLTGTREYRVYFTEPFLLNKTLSKIISAYYERVVIMDIGINPQVYDEILEYLKILRENNIPVYWYDHHVWEEKWMNDVKDKGIELYIDQSTCATGVVAKYVETTRRNIDQVFISELVNGVCAGDLWLFNHWLGPYYIRLVRRKDPDSWRKHVLSVLASGRYWSGEFDEKVLDHLEKELALFSDKNGLKYVIKNINGLKIIVSESNVDVENSFLASYLIGRMNVDIAILATSDGKLSFRSKDIDVRNLALSLGGGGHMYASGAKIEIPWWIRTLSKVNKNAILNYIANLVISKLGKSTYLRQ